MTSLPGGFKKGDSVRLRRPSECAGSFSNPRAVLEVAELLYYRPGAPSYVLCEPGGPGVTPFTDSDLKRARRSPTAARTGPENSLE